jgi:hypothetical protein
MTSMRAIFILATIVTLSAPPVAWVAAVDVSSPVASSMSIGSQAAFASHLVRAIAKSDKTFSFGCALAAEAPSLLLPAGSRVLQTLAASDPPNLDLRQPPLAARPPPLA